jgi:hypothetical protein
VYCYVIRYQNTTASFVATSAIVLWIENRENLGGHCAGLRELLVQREGMRNTGTLNRMWDMSYKLQNCQLESCTVSVFVEGRDRKCVQSGTRLVRSRNHNTCSHRTIYTLVIKITRKSMVNMVESSWNVMARGDAREGKWRGKGRMEWVASILHTTSEHGVSGITTADAHTSAASNQLNWRPRRFKWTRPFRRKTKTGFCACAITFQTQSTKTTIARS